MAKGLRLIYAFFLKEFKTTRAIGQSHSMESTEKKMDKAVFCAVFFYPLLFNLLSSGEDILSHSNNAYKDEKYHGFGLAYTLPASPAVEGGEDVQGQKL